MQVPLRSVAFRKTRLPHRRDMDMGDRRDAFSEEIVVKWVVIAWRVGHDKEFLKSTIPV